MSQLFGPDVQATLDARAARLARPSADAVERTERFVTFRRAEHRFAISATDLLRAGPLQRPTRLPSAPPHLLGLVHLNGQVVGVLDLERLDRPEAPQPSQPFAVWVSRGPGGVLLIADELLDLVELRGSVLAGPVKGAFAGRLSQRLRAVLPDGLLVLEPRLLLDPELFSTQR